MWNSSICIFSNYWIIYLLVNNILSLGGLLSNVKFQYSKHRKYKAMLLWPIIVKTKLWNSKRWNNCLFTFPMNLINNFSMVLWDMKNIIFIIIIIIIMFYKSVNIRNNLIYCIKKLLNWPEGFQRQFFKWPQIGMTYSIPFLNFTLRCKQNLNMMFLQFNANISIYKFEDFLEF